MIRIATASGLAAFAIAVGAVTPATADAAIEAAVTLLATIPADPAKLDRYCTLVAKMKAAGPEGPLSDELDDAFDAMLVSFGPGFDKVVEVSEDVEDASPEGQALNAGFAAVEARCPR
jgi:hypothetical protein